MEILACSHAKLENGSWASADRRDVRRSLFFAADGGGDAVEVSIRNAASGVKLVGWAHGIFFIAYGFTVLTALVNGQISFRRSLLAFGASLIPFGPFLIDRKLAEDEVAKVSAD